MNRLLAVLLAVLLTGCATKTPVTVDPVKSAYDLLVGAKAYLDKAYQLHPECSKDSIGTTTLCNDLHLAEVAKDDLATALDTFCAGPAYDLGNGVCQTPTGTMATAAQAKLQGDIASYNSIAKKLSGEL